MDSSEEINHGDFHTLFSVSHFSVLLGDFAISFLICYEIFNKIVAHNFSFYFIIVCGVNRHVTTDIPSDLLVQVGEVSFYLHKVVFFFLITFGMKFHWLIIILKDMICFARKQSS